MTFEINLVSWVRWLFLTRIHLNQFIHFVLFTHKVHVLTADSSDSLLVVLSKCSFCAFTKPPADRDQQIYRRQRCRQPDWSCFFLFGSWCPWCSASLSRLHAALSHREHTPAQSDPEMEKREQKMGRWMILDLQNHSISGNNFLSDGTFWFRLILSSWLHLQCFAV